MEFNPQIQLAGLLEWMAEQMNACHGKTAVIGISGGKDSSVVAALCVEALGKERVIGVLLPGSLTPPSLKNLSKRCKRLIFLSIS